MPSLRADSTVSDPVTLLMISSRFMTEAFSVYMKPGASRRPNATVSRRTRAAPHSSSSCIGVGVASLFGRSDPGSAQTDRNRTAVEGNLICNLLDLDYSVYATSGR